MAKNYEIREIELDDGIEEYIISMQERAYGRVFETNAISKNTDNHFSGLPTLHLGAFQNEKIIAYNAFTPHTFTHNGKPIISYQSGWAISDPDVKVWGSYFDVIITAKKRLKERGGSFIFGFPNENSEPIFTKTLKFSSCKLYTGKVIANPLYIQSKVKHIAAPSNLSYINTTKEQFKFKEIARPNEKIHYFEERGDYIWGKVNTKKKYGVQLKYFVLGGFEINSSNTLSLLLQKVAKKLPIHYIEIVTHPRSILTHYMPSLKESDKTEPFIFHDLKKSGLDALHHFNICSGIKDAY